MKAYAKHRKLIALLLSVVLLIGMLPLGVFAVNAESVQGELVVDKTAILEDDGTYTLNMSAYATGSTVTVEDAVAVPLDIVLVIDHSGSIDTKKLNALRESATLFAEMIRDNAKENNVDHRMAMIGFSEDEFPFIGVWENDNHGIYIDGAIKPYHRRSQANLTAEDYQKAMVPVYDVSAENEINADITRAIANIDPHDGTYISDGMEMAKNVFINNPLDEGSLRKRVVVVFTDGVPGDGDGFEYGDAKTEANATFPIAKDIKTTYNALIYTIGLFTQTSNEQNEIDKFMSLLSSNSSDAVNMDAVMPTETHYYSQTTDTNVLENVFQKVSWEVTGTAVTLGIDSILRDYLAEGFHMTERSTATARIADVTMENGVCTLNPASAVPFPNVTADPETGTIDVFDFDYKEYFVTDNHPGKTVMLTVTGIEATDPLFTGATVFTNDALSGLYADAAALEAGVPQIIFNRPTTVLTKQVDVMDYGVTCAVDLGAMTAKHVALTPAGFSAAQTSVAGTFGTLAVDAQGKLTYTPDTTNWNAPDTFYVFGTTTEASVLANSANTNGNVWHKVTFVPANNIYYEDDNAGILYQGTWTQMGTNDAVETANGAVYGWETALADDKTYSAGSAFVSDTVGAQASITFTGTGIDVYSTTDYKSGIVMALLKDASTGTTLVKKLLMVDTLAVSDTYYQIPTLSFTGLAYGEYTVDLVVSSSSKDEVIITAAGSHVGGRTEFALDGVRIYNPLTTADEAVYYAAEEQTSTFVEVRDVLLANQAFNANGTTGNAGTVFIDQMGPDGAIGATAPTITQYEDWGPKNEVYLAKDQMIVFAVNDPAKTYAIGLKSPTGGNTIASFMATEGSASVTVGHTSDLYYTVTPDGVDTDGDGAVDTWYITVKNTGDALLSVTKLKVSGAASVAGVNVLAEVPLSALAAYAAEVYEASPKATGNAQADAWLDAITSAENPYHWMKAFFHMEEAMTYASHLMGR